MSATVNGKKRTVFGGNLIQQRTQLLEWLQDQDINPLLRVKRRSTHEAAIDVHPTKAITFTNPGGLPDAIAVRVSADSDGRFRPVPNVSYLRNRSLCDVFFGLQAMEREGTGLVDVERMALEAGGATAFTNDSKGNVFVAQIEQLCCSDRTAGGVGGLREHCA